MRGIVWKTGVWMLFAMGAAPWAQAQVTLSPKYHSFGKIEPGKIYRFSVKITNPTSQTLSLWNLRTDCDCTTAHIPKPVLKPKESTQMTVQYHPPLGEDGFRNQSVEFQVYSEDKNRAIHKTVQKFLFNASLHSSYVFDPPVLDGGYVITGHANQRHGFLKLDAKAYPRWKPAAPQVSVQGLEASVEPLPTPGSYDVVLSVPATLQAGVYSGDITIGGSGKKDARFEYPFKAVVGSLWSLSPAVLDLPTAPDQAKKWAQTTHVHQIYNKPFKVLRIDGLPDWLKYQLGKDPIGDTTLEWRIDEGRFEKEKGKGLPEKLTVHTDLASEPDFFIRVQGLGVAPVKASHDAGPAMAPTSVPKKDGCKNC